MFVQICTLGNLWQIFTFAKSASVLLTSVFHAVGCAMCRSKYGKERKNAQEIFPRNSSRDLSLKTAFVASHFVTNAARAAAGQPPCHLGRLTAAWEGRKAHCFFESMPSDSSVQNASVQYVLDEDLEKNIMKLLGAWKTVKGPPKVAPVGGN